MYRSGCLDNAIKVCSPSSEESEPHPLIRLSACFSAICDDFEAGDIVLELCREGRN